MKPVLFFLLLLHFVCNTVAQRRPAPPHRNPTQPAATNTVINDDVNGPLNMIIIDKFFWQSANAIVLVVVFNSGTVSAGQTVEMKGVTERVTNILISEVHAGGVRVGSANRNTERAGKSVGLVIREGAFTLDDFTRGMMLSAPGYGYTETIFYAEIRMTNLSMYGGQLRDGDRITILINHHDIPNCEVVIEEKDASGIPVPVPLNTKRTIKIISPIPIAFPDNPNGIQFAIRYQGANLGIGKVVM